MFTFRQGRPEGKVKCRLSKKSTVFQDAYYNKYNLNDESQLNTEVSLMQVDSAANSAIAPHRPETEAKHIFMMGPDPNRSKNFNGIYISPESHQKRVITKKKSTPGGTSVDLRFKMKDLEYASNMSSDDFFLAGTASKTCSQKSTERPHQEESVEDKVS